MRYARFTQCLILLAALLLATAAPFAQGKPGNTTANRLILDGKPLDYARFSRYATGLLTLVAENPKIAGAPKIAFRIYLQRGNQSIKSGGSMPDRSVSEIEVSQVLAAAKNGDYLIIEPVRNKVAGTRCLIKLTDYLPAGRYKWVFPYWLFGARKSDGC